VTDKTSTALTSSSAAGVIRALLDFRSVWTTHDLVALSRVPAPTIHRVVGYLEREELVTRTANAVVAVPDWLALVHRWSRDFQFSRECTTTHWQPIGGLGALADRIPATTLPYAVTGAFAANQWARTTAANPMTIYTPDPHTAAEAWNLIPTSTGDVILATPSTDVVYTRPRKTPTGLRLAAPTQVLTDLLTGASQSPTPAAALQTWMQAHELEWRY
jgi:hypothetical protein